MVTRRRSRIAFLTRELRAAAGRAPARRRARMPLGDVEREWLRGIETHGFAVVANYLAPATCDRLCRELDALLARHEKAVQRSSGGADERLLGADRISEGFRAFWNDPRLRAAQRAYCGSRRQVGFTMANRIRSAPGNRGSGDGWHRDTIHGRQFKAILYLTDVDARHGPLQYWRGSHRPWRRLCTPLRLGTSLFDNRFEGDRCDDLLAREPCVETLAAPRGTLILADTTGIHRGKPLSSGVRYAMTNYYFDDALPPGWPVLNED